jgi:hypothetical protein
VKKIILVLAVIVGLGASAQADTTTSNYALIMPSSGSVNWAGKINYDISVISTMTASKYNPNDFSAASTQTWRGAVGLVNSSMTLTGSNGFIVSQSSITGDHFGNGSHLSNVAAVTATTANNLASGAAGQVPQQTGSGATGFLPAMGDGGIIIGAGTGVIATTGTLTGTANRVTVTRSASGIALSGPQDLGTGSSPTFVTVTAALSGNATTATSATSATTATNLAGGGAGQLPYQSAAGATTFMPSMGAAGIVVGNGSGIAPSTATLTGTSNQVTVTQSATAVTLSLPQSVNSGATPTFTATNFSGTSGITGLGTQAQALNMGTHQINGVTDPTSAQDAATKNYVDTNANTYSFKAAARWATTAALPSNSYNNGAGTITGLSIGALSLDGAVVGVGDRVLVKNEATQSHNGLYSVTQNSTLVVFILTRTTDANTAADFPTGTAVLVDSGTVNADTGWVTTSSVTTLGTDPINWVQYSGPGIVVGDATMNVTNYSTGSITIGVNVIPEAKVTSLVSDLAGKAATGANSDITSMSALARLSAALTVTSTATITGLDANGNSLKLSGGVTGSSASVTYGYTGSTMALSGALTASSATLTASGSNTFTLTLSSGVHLTAGCVTWSDGTQQCSAPASGGTLGGSGTANYSAKFTGASNVGNGNEWETSTGTTHMQPVLFQSSATAGPVTLTSTASYVSVYKNGYTIVASTSPSGQNTTCLYNLSPNYRYRVHWLFTQLGSVGTPKGRMGQSGALDSTAAHYKWHWLYDLSSSAHAFSNSDSEWNNTNNNPVSVNADWSGDADMFPNQSDTTQWTIKGMTHFDADNGGDGFGPAMIGWKYLGSSAPDQMCLYTSAGTFSGKFYIEAMVRGDQ